MEQNLKDYSWDLGEYTPRASQAERGKLTLHDALNAYQLKPAPPASPDGKKDDYICLAQQTSSISMKMKLISITVSRHFLLRKEDGFTRSDSWI